MIMHLPRGRTSPERHGDLTRSMSSSSKAVAGAWPPAPQNRIGPCQPATSANIDSGSPR
jgi:hypothetical protein